MEVFQKVLGWKADATNGVSGIAMPFQTNGVTGAVSLAGRLNGIVYASFTEALAERAAQSVLGDPSLVDHATVNDVVGELTNMISGNIKAKMANVGYACRLSIPTVMRGQAISIDAGNTPISVGSTFTFDNHPEIANIHFFARLETDSI
ncbi:MAG: chemotaxis protein CheX [Chthoniobacteraceae bacterium]